MWPYDNHTLSVQQNRCSRTPFRVVTQWQLEPDTHSPFTRACIFQQRAPMLRILHLQWQSDIVILARQEVLQSTFSALTPVTIGHCPFSTENAQGFLKCRDCVTIGHCPFSTENAQGFLKCRDWLTFGHCPFNTENAQGFLKCRDVWQSDIVLSAQKMLKAS